MKEKVRNSRRTFIRKSLSGLGLALLAPLPNILTYRPKPLIFSGSVKNDLYLFLKEEGFNIKQFNRPSDAIRSATPQSAVFIVSDSYPKVNKKSQITSEMLKIVHEKELRLYVEYPSSFPNLEIETNPIETTLKRGVITSTVFGEELKSMDLLDLHNAYILPVKVNKPLIVLAKVVGFDKAVYGLKDTKTNPLLFEREGVLISMSKLSNFKTGRYGPKESVKKVWTYIISRLIDKKDYEIKKWPDNVIPMYRKDEKLPVDARIKSIQKGVEWYYNGRFFVHPSWKSHLLKYQGDGIKPFGPPLDKNVPIGDGTHGIIEGHASIINYDGSQQYRYWMRNDVQGEVAMALASAGELLKEDRYLKHSENLIDYIFEESNLRSGKRDDKNSSVYGLIGWATTHPDVFYGDDNARAILGIIGTSAYLETDKWDRELVEAIMANFRTTGKYGFRGERLEQDEILERGWKYYWDREIFHPSPHFECWLWACYLWLYKKTGYKPLLKKTKRAIKMTMEAYPEEWLWGSSLQTQRARMILPLAWLIRIEDTKESREWLQQIVNDMLSDQVQSGAIREEIGSGVGRFKPRNSNKDYGIDESSLIFENGDPVSDMLYTCNFALFSLNEAAKATGNKSYKMAARNLSEFLVRIQVKSQAHQDLDGAWFRAFDYKRWDYWASNADKGWGAWCTLTGWSQSWIVFSQLLLEENTSFWEETNKINVNKYFDQVSDLLFPESN